ncbi:unnamed protein product [Lupinus luteus]|uniref:Uncharacterized protein n=1 Tax=Lupinus luteus TaxID=3873 RepID=A0AAV1WG85_LUPLU
MMMCCHSRFILLLLSSMLFLSFGYGLGRVEATFEDKYSGAENEEYNGKMGMKFETLDYAEPEPNTNPKIGYLLSPPSPVPAPPPHS